MEAFVRRPSTVAARGRRTALPSATPRRRTTLPALLLAALATLVGVVAAPAAQAAAPAAVTGSQGPKGTSTGSASAATPGTTHRTARSSVRGSAGSTVGSTVGAVGAVAAQLAPRTSHVAPSAGTGPDGAHQLLPQPALPPHVAAPAPPVTPLRHTAVAVPPPAGRPLVVSPGRSPPADPRRA